jgi:hypothetical protein
LVVLQHLSGLVLQTLVFLQADPNYKQKDYD